MRNAVHHPSGPPNGLLASRMTFALASIVCLLAWSNASGQVPGGPNVTSATDSITKQIEDGKHQLESNSGLDDDSKARLQGLFEKADEAVQDANAKRKQSEGYQQQIQTVSDDLKAIETALADLKQPPSVSETASIEQITQQLAQSTSELTAAEKRAADLAAEPVRRERRLSEIPAELTDNEAKLQQTREQLGQPAPGNETPLETRARNTLLNARAAQLQQTLDSLRNEQATYLATASLLPRQKTLADAEVKALRGKIDLLRRELSERQLRQARDETDQLRRAAAEAPDFLQSLTTSNIQLSELHQSMIQDAEEAQRTLSEVKSRFDDLTSELETASKRVDAVGLTEALGLLFRERQQVYNQLRVEFQPRPDLQEQVQQYQIKAFRLEDEARKIDEILASNDQVDLDRSLSDIDWGNVSNEEARLLLLKSRRELIEQTLRTQNLLVQTMISSDTQRRELLQSIDEYDSFVNRHLFWTRSAPPFSIGELVYVPDAIAYLTSASSWQRLFGHVLRSLQTFPIRCVLLAAALLALLMFRGRLRRVTIREGQQAHRFDATFHSTIVALVATVLAAAVWPVLFWSAAYVLEARPSADSLIRGLGNGLELVVPFIVAIEWLKEMCRNDGLAESHFGWGEDVRKLLRRHLRWYLPIGACCYVLMPTFRACADTAVATLGSRVFCVTLFLATALFHHRLFRQASPIYTQLVRSNPDSMIYRSRKWLWWILAASPLLPAMMALSGYLDTTFRLSRSMQSSLLLAVVIVLVFGLISRWLTLRRRDVARRKAHEARQRRIAELEHGPEETLASETGIVIEEEEPTDLPTLDHHTRQTAFILVGIAALICLAFIWSDVLPAFEYFAGKTLWPVGTGESIEYVTLLDILSSLALVFVLGIAIRNLPSTLEYLVLSRTSMDNGARYAITTLLRYALVVVGALVVLNLLSVPYQQLGWLLAAISVGLGFGLQEIVANFVSGIILLLERPVRVGDIVTVGDTTGIVSRIQMRATTVTNWDRKELIIPNKDLITGTILNWSLTNMINRLTIEVGVAYGSDPDQVRDILRRTVMANPEVLDDPAPLISFETFGDSSLNFAVRLYLQKLDNRIEVTHQINTAIAKAFEKAGIEIPFPQRDLHFKLEEFPAIEKDRALE
ncbi:mechanosensitive ion channel [Roseiconus nitratireducens]|uniref:Mechanosensitive ion channel n=1 Tax=Roseiconus nitratireducens TaxID=2605748 RepID=A0A5M6CV26_9BACT|nr:mechanosensitive ion channel domain-containing protein [Roseiconus nitratireducens]KAA5539097.1 mechanosensitive ion channel [Roseiconus nitratireducens]